jgi:hypothetical protein
MVPGPNPPQCYICGWTVHWNYALFIEEHSLVGKEITQVMDCVYGEGHQDGKRELDPHSKEKPQEFVITS